VFIEDHFGQVWAARTGTTGRYMGTDSKHPDGLCTITPYRDGPLIVRGPVRLQDMQGREIVTGRNPVALCRCGRSGIRPLCDGTHKLSRFRAPSGREDGRTDPEGSKGSG
jgi:CDGSH-type Zn-finger protein